MITIISPPTHSFDTRIATELGSVEMAILIQHFNHWITYNAAANKNLHDGKYWTYCTLEDLAYHFPYWSKHQVNRIINKLVEKEIIVKGNYNKTSYDRTNWYSFNEKFFSILRNRKMEETKSQDGCFDIATPIPDINTYIKTNKKIDKRKFPKAKTAVKTALASDDAHLCVNYLFDKLKETAPESKPPNVSTWAADFDRMMNIDSIPRNKIIEAIDFVSRDDNTFVVLSAAALRKKYQNITHHIALGAKKREKIKQKKDPKTAKALETTKKYLEGVYAGCLPDTLSFIMTDDGTVQHTIKNRIYSGEYTKFMDLLKSLNVPESLISMIEEEVEKDCK